MRYTKVDSDGNGGSRIVDIPIEMTDAPTQPHIPPLRVSEPVPADSVVFVELPGGGTDDDWHPAPRRQLTVILSGVVEVETTDGCVRRFGPGEVAMAADMDGGRGHVLRIIEAPVQTMFISLVDE